MNALKVKRVKYPTEHERRFFPDLKTFTFDKSLYVSKLILQSYLEDDKRTRIRDELDSENDRVYLQTRKTGVGVSRLEDEVVIEKGSYDAMLQLATCGLVKRRYFVPYGKYVIEVNFFEGDLAGYVHIEVEFATKKEAEAFVPPDWIGLEVTHDKRHDNYWLAKYGCKELLLC